MNRRMLRNCMRTSWKSRGRSSFFLANMRKIKSANSSVTSGLYMFRCEGFLGNVLGQQFLRRTGSAERRPAGHHLVTSRAETVDIGPTIQGLSADLFRRHVTARALGFDLAKEELGPASRDALSQGEIDEANISTAGDQNIVRLHVAMDPAFGVHKRQSRSRLLENVLPLFARRKSVSFRMMRMLQVAGREILHHEIGVVWRWDRP